MNRHYSRGMQTRCLIQNALNSRIIYYSVPCSVKSRETFFTTAGVVCPELWALWKSRTVQRLNPDAGPPPGAGRRAGRQLTASWTRSAGDDPGFVRRTFCSGMSAQALTKDSEIFLLNVNSLARRDQNSEPPRQVWVAVNSGGSGISASETSCRDRWQV